MTRSLSKRRLMAGINSIQVEASGAMQVSLVSSETGRELVLASMLGDHEATAMMKAVAQSAMWIKQAASSRPILCVACPEAVRTVTPRTIFGVASPAKSDPGNLVAFAFCDACAANPNHLMAKAMEGLKRIWPDLRPTEITHPDGGCA